MSGPAIFQEGDPAVSRNPIFSTQQNEATGMANVPGQFAGSADAISQLVQLMQARKDQAIGQLARLHAAVDNGMFPQAIFDSPEAQDLFQKAGLDAMAHQKLLPKPSDQITQMKSDTLANPAIFPAGGPAERAVTGLPTDSQINVQGQADTDTQQPAVARVVGKLPVPAAAATREGADVQRAQNESTAETNDAEQLKFGGVAFKDAEKRYDKDPSFHAFVDAVHMHVLQPYVEALKQSIANTGLEKQAAADAVKVFSQALTTAPTTYTQLHKDWLDRQSAEEATFRQSQELSDDSEEDKSAALQDHMNRWNFQHHEPTMASVTQQALASSANVLGMTGEQQIEVLKDVLKVKSPAARLHTTPARNPLVGSIIEQAKHDPKHITIDFNDGTGAHTGTLEHLLTVPAPKGPLTAAEIYTIKAALKGQNPQGDPNGGGASGGGRRPVQTVPIVPPKSRSQVP